MVSPSYTVQILVNIVSGELPIEELMKKYAAAYDGDAEEFDAGTPDESTASEESSDEEEEEEDEEEESEGMEI